MLVLLNLLQLVLYIALLALLGQGVLHVLAGPRREANVFYRALRVVPSPFTGLVRRLTPARVANRHVPILTFVLLLLAYVVVTIEKIQHCVGQGMHGCL
jgi:hypothetical protein